MPAASAPPVSTVTVPEISSPISSPIESMYSPSGTMYPCMCFPSHRAVYVPSLISIIGRISIGSHKPSFNIQSSSGPSPGEPVAVIRVVSPITGLKGSGSATSEVNGMSLLTVTVPEINSFPVAFVTERMYVPFGTIVPQVMCVPFQVAVYVPAGPSVSDITWTGSHQPSLSIMSSSGPTPAVPITVICVDSTFGLKGSGSALIDSSVHSPQLTITVPLASSCPHLEMVSVYSPSGTTVPQSMCFPSQVARYSLNE